MRGGVLRGRFQRRHWAEIKFIDSIESYVTQKFSQYKQDGASELSPHEYCILLFRGHSLLDKILQARYNGIVHSDVQPYRGL
jgi:hypothetical protein